MPESDSRPAAVAGHFYPSEAGELSQLVADYLSHVDAEPCPARAAIVPHAGLAYSGRCAAEVFGRIKLPRIAVIVAPNHSGVVKSPGASLWSRGRFETPLGAVAVDRAFCERLEADCPLVGFDRAAHRREHAVEVELPFLASLRPDVSIVPILIAWDDWSRSERLAADLASIISEWVEPVLLVASSDMTHFESAEEAARRDRFALDAIVRLDGQELLSACQRERVTMCGRAPAAIVVEAARRLGADQAEVVDYRNSSWVTGDRSNVVAYAGVVIF